MAWFPLFFLFVMLPSVDYLLGHDPANIPADRERDRRARSLVQGADPAGAAGATRPAGVVRVVVRRKPDLGFVGQAGWLLSQGVVGGILAINTAHELIHKDGRLEPWTGGVLLASVGYHGFKVEHLRGHHVHVSTPEDASSARFGQSLVAFPAARVAGATPATPGRWKQQRLRKLRTLAAVVAQRIAVVDGALAGVRRGVLRWRWAASAWRSSCCRDCSPPARWKSSTTSSTTAWSAGATADGRYERTTHLHSWNSDYALSNLMLFQLQRHSDHHALPETPLRDPAPP